ncbi:MAG TPA: DUF4388 domain-containing protein [Polyangiaceae bacterium LLY-WYZ-15_(1-7)]|nr:hypothetical protein [Sandaracinus sp.]HJL03997.1 DUF4388 domain-containing protein [Polyangiaceae bacterium LLY-WYZ-15_(1-7)]MBJ72826.1 hypothetical protein [Sandaracinus sp.]HJL10535.1 DUF4388 domain-containing protein [Polyangiaceae bacterium LLY-WYZ-15_(1-7)]HJL21155.1 DUF4388 domain-containing protein [Polyangiaceae bacterium LLY-WYZ-15_(1-7)]
MARQRRVLIVDPIDTVRRIAQRTLEGAGYEVRAEAEGRAGLDVAQRYVPDLVLVDVSLPDLPGRAFCEALRAISNLREVPVVVMSARAQLLEGVDGAADGIRKPFGPEALLAVTARALEREEAHAEDPFAEAEEDAAERRERAAAVRAALEGFLLQLAPDLDAGAKLAELPDARGLALAQELGRLAAGGEVALRGRLEHVGLGEVLQLLGQTHSGVLRVESEDGRAVVICLREGRVDLALARGVPSEFLLGRYLVAEDLIDPADLERLLRRPSGRPGEAGGERGRLGQRLIKLGYITREDLQQALARQTSELVYEALRWPRGRFAFFRYATRDEAREAALGLPVTSILMEGLRRVDEWRLIEEQVASFDLVVQIDRRALTPAHEERMSPDERAVLDVIDGRRSVRELIAKTGLGSFEVCKVLYQLLAARLVRAV